MRYVKSAALILALSTTAMQANAGIWDSITSFFGSSDEENVTEVAPVAAPVADTTSMMNKGLQLLPLLTQQLGVSGEQAQGGMGALLQAAQILMSDTKFGALTQVIPNMSSLLSSAPTVSNESGGLTDNLMKMAAEQSETVKTGTQLVSQFQSLGMGADMIPKFTGVAEDYLKQSSDPSTANLLTSALSSIIK